MLHWFWRCDNSRLLTGYVDIADSNRVKSVKSELVENKRVSVVKRSYLVISGHRSTRV